MVIADALGAPLEFSSLRYDTKELLGFDEKIWKKNEYNNFMLKPGQWTDGILFIILLLNSNY